ncbi:Nucleic acid-binding OB-fold [Penicillium cf. griseofulvum]|uniref:Nucleic acid-binding OB-fold n=1 Tax=Penicillium cf. griseofulvum TaxID=2972120 RepID=A0A9W9T5H8_9EURO|nr:Nucleic acid-binding OB-fold [Penicillium cf. griseofulvum]KAJ5421404.1 Nucleic acid-binding OB-fold [Penicillium cf. griseofulvum]KAJ5424635.1 Nucleic acid-binding OB-fold [Penicillium cf. griseofulvum]
MSYFKTEYQRFLDNPRTAKLADDASLIYVPTTTKFEQADNVITHVLKNAKIVKTKSNQVISAIEGSDSLCLDMETTLEFTEGGGVYLPSLDDNFLADRVATFPTVHIVHFDSNQLIKQIRIYWDQASLLKQVEVIGARGRQWPIRDGKDQLRLLKNAETARAAPSQPPSQKVETKLPDRSSSPGKRRFKDPYSANSLTELLSPNKEAAERESRAEAPRPASSSKRYTKDPYGAGSLNELLSPSKKPPAPVAPFAPASARPATRNFSDIFVKDDDTPDSPSKTRRAPRVDEEDEKPIKGPVDEDRHFYKSAPGKYNHFEIGGDNSEREIKAEVKQAKTPHSTHWDFDDFETPVKGSRVPRGEEVRHFGFGDNEEGASAQTKLDVAKPRRDADRHFDMTDEETEEDGRIISSFGGRGKRLYENRLFDSNGQAELSEREQKSEPLSTGTNVGNRNKNFVSQFELVDESPASKENKPTQKHDAHNKMMESHWDNYDEQSPLPTQAHTQHNKAMESHWDNYDEQSPLPTQAHTQHNKAMESHWDNYDEQSPLPTQAHTQHNKAMESNWGNYDEESPKPTQKHDAHNKMMESHWDNYEDPSPEPVRRNATAQRNPLGHNQPSWNHEDN